MRGIIHIAAKKQVGESVADPLKYYRENVDGTIGAARGRRRHRRRVVRLLLERRRPTACRDLDIVDRGRADRADESLRHEQADRRVVARDVAAATGLRVIALRYFNVAGAASPELGDPGVFNLDPDGVRAHRRRRAAAHLRRRLPDTGRHLRPRLHPVVDIADAHVAALEDLASRGNGDARSASTTSAAARDRASARCSTPSRRSPAATSSRSSSSGGPATRPASSRARNGSSSELGWTAKHDLDDMVASAWAAWQHRH